MSKSSEERADSVTLRFPAPNPPLSINRSNRMHWAAKKRALDPWRESVWASWVNCRRKEKVKNIPCSVRVYLPFSVKRRRDPHNYTGTNVKAIIDALVTCGVWPDDTPEWVRVQDPVCVVNEDCRVVLVPRDE